MALADTTGTTAPRSVTGIPVGVIPAGAEWPVLIQRAPDAGGVPGTWADLVVVQVPADGGVYIDPLPVTALLYWYRVRTRRTGYNDSALYGGQVSGRAFVVDPSTLGTLATVLRSGIGPSLDVRATPGGSSYSVAFSGFGTITYAIDGGAYAPAPASPLVVTRNAAGGADKVVTFKATKDGQEITNAVVVPAIGATDTDTVAPDLVVSPGSMTGTTQAYVVSATNPKNLVPNSSAEEAGTGGYAEGWAAYASIQNPALVGSNVVDGAVAQYVEANGGVAARVRAPLSPVVEGRTYVASAYVTAAAGQPLQLNIKGFNSGGSEVWQGGSWAFTATGAAQRMQSGALVIPAGVAFIAALPGFVGTVPAGTALTVDAVQIEEGTVPSAFSPSPLLTVTLTGTGGTASASGAITAGVPKAVKVGETITVNRPAFAAAPAMMTVRAGIARGGAEIVQRSIPNQDKTVFGPTLSVTTTPGTSQFSIAYTATGTVEYSVDGGAWGAAPASPFLISRNAAGGAQKTVAVRATADGQTVSDTVTIPPQEPAAPPPSIDSAYATGFNVTTDVITLAWAVSNAPAGATYDLAFTVNDAELGPAGETVIAGVSSPYSHDNSGTGGHTLDLITPIKGSEYRSVQINYQLRMKNSGGTVVATKDFSFVAVVNAIVP